MSTATAGGRSPGLPRPRLPRLTPARAGALLAVVAILVGGWFWFRASSLVAIEQVRVTGLSGPDVSQIVGALTGEAREMTTLDVSTAKLERAVSGFGHIAGVSVATHFPHAVTIAVNEQLPVASLRVGGGYVAVDRAGQLLARVATAGLPQLPAAPSAGGSQVTSPGTLATLAVLGAAPYQLLSHIASARATAAHGVTVQLRNGPVIYFGNPTQLALKWSAADGALASPDSAGAAYIDVTAPSRPAAG
jgi:cell division protein FtsQ